MLKIENKLINAISLVPNPYSVIGIDAIIFAIDIIAMKYIKLIFIENNFEIKNNSKNCNNHPPIDNINRILRWDKLGKSS